MEVIVHPPEGERERGELARRVAGLHARFILGYLEKIPCSAGQKRQLLDAVGKELRRGEGGEEHGETL